MHVQNDIVINEVYMARKLNLVKTRNEHQKLLRRVVERHSEPLQRNVSGESYASATKKKSFHAVSPRKSAILCNRYDGRGALALMYKAQFRNGMLVENSARGRFPMQ
ncbi:hypothetical protein O3G_MSEX007631 [Manduca sexta]|uniref:Uncharacterized protein n=1 Tax=Manduca sexta TaxID=7130 RepID=A0A921Z7M0_MANSE|nr:hypothetical protein O3G_MSEX007631 [Manduca sexta]